MCSMSSRVRAGPSRPRPTTPTSIRSSVPILLENMGCDAEQNLFRGGSVPGYRGCYSLIDNEGHNLVAARGSLEVRRDRHDQRKRWDVNEALDA